MRLGAKGIAVIDRLQDILEKTSRIFCINRSSESRASLYVCDVCVDVYRSVFISHMATGKSVTQWISPKDPEDL